MTYNLNIDDYIGRWGYSKQYVRNQLAGLKGKPVNVRISSLGGAVDDGLDIRQQFVDHGDVTAVPVWAGGKFGYYCRTGCEKGVHFQILSVPGAQGEQLGGCLGAV